MEGRSALYQKLGVRSMLSLGDRMVRSMKTVILPLWGANGVKNAALEETEHLI